MRRLALLACALLALALAADANSRLRASLQRFKRLPLLGSGVDPTASAGASRTSLSGGKPGLPPGVVPAVVDLSALGDEASREKLLADWQQVSWKPTPQMKPVFLVPGAMGSALAVKATGPDSIKTEAFTCLGARQKLYQAWASGSQCRLPLLSLTIDSKVPESNPRRDCEVEISGGFGSIDAIYNVVGGGIKASVAAWLAGDYMRTIIKAFERAGFKRNENLFAAPYDWRYKPTSRYHGRFYNHLQQSIENAVKKSGKKAVLAAHSMGNLVVSQFFKNLEAKGQAAWIENNIDRFVSIAAPWAGAPASYVHLFSGSNLLGKMYRNAQAIRGIMRTVAQTIDGLGYLAPSPLQKELWAGAGVKYDGKTYGVDKIADALKAAAQPPENADFFQKVTEVADRPGLKPPAAMAGGKICSIFYYGAEPAANLHTLLMPEYDKKPDLTVYEDGKGAETDGDGTVPAVSATVFKKWGASAAWAGTCGGNNRFFVQVGNCKMKDGSFKACDHSDMLNYNQQLIRDLIEHAGGDPVRLVSAPPADGKDTAVASGPAAPPTPTLASQSAARAPSATSPVTLVSSPGGAASAPAAPGPAAASPIL